MSLAGIGKYQALSLSKTEPNHLLSAVKIILHYKYFEATFIFEVSVACHIVTDRTSAFLLQQIPYPARPATFPTIFPQ